MIGMVTINDEKNINFLNKERKKKHKKKINKKQDIYTLSITMEEAPPPPLQIAATPSLPLS